MTRKSRGNHVDKTLSKGQKPRLNDWSGKSFAYCPFHWHIGFNGYVGLTRLENSTCSLPDSGIVSILLDSDVDDENPAAGTMRQDRIRAQGYGALYDCILFLEVSHTHTLTCPLFKASLCHLHMRVNQHKV